MKRQFETLQAGRGLAALAVVFYHTNVAFSSPHFFGREIAPWAKSGDSGVCFFFVLSGVVMMLAHRADVGSGAVPLAFWWSRARRLLPALWVALCLTLAFLAFRGRLDDVNLGVLISAFLLLPAQHEVVLSVEWTLRLEVQFYLIFGLAIWKRELGAAVLLTWTALSLTPLFLPVPDPLAALLSPYNVLFLIGVVTAHFATAPNLARPRILASAGVAIFGTTWLANAYGGDLALYAKIAGYGLGSALMIAGFMATEALGRLTVHGTLKALGDASYSIYLIHFMFVAIFASLAVKLHAHLPLPLIVLFAVVAAASCLVGYLLHIFVERPVTRLVPARLR